MAGCGSAWLERLVWDQEVAGSNPVTPIDTKCASGSGVEHHLAKVGAAGSNPVSRSPKKGNSALQGSFLLYKEL